MAFEIPIHKSDFVIHGHSVPLVLVLLLALAGWVNCQGNAETWKDLDQEALKLFQSGKTERSIETTKRALETAQRDFGEESTQTAKSMSDLGALYRYIGRTDEGEELKRHAITLREKINADHQFFGLQSEIFFDQVAQRKAGMVRKQQIEWFRQHGLFILMAGTVLGLLVIWVLRIVRRKRIVRR